MASHLIVSSPSITVDFIQKNIAEQKSSDTFLEVVSFMSSYYSLILLLVGCVSNPLSFCVLSRRAFRASTMSVYLRFLTVSDTTALLLGLLRFFMLSTFEVSDLRENLVGCHVHVWLVNISFYSSSWTLVVVTLERVVSIVWPHKVKIICTPSISKLILVILVVVWAAILSNHFVLFGHLTVLNPASNDTFLRHCTIVYNRDFSNKVYWAFDGINFAILPTCFLAVSNVIIANGVIKSRRRVGKTAIAQKKMNRSDANPHDTLTLGRESANIDSHNALTYYTPQSSDSLSQTNCHVSTMRKPGISSKVENTSVMELIFVEVTDVGESTVQITGENLNNAEQKQSFQNKIDHPDKLYERGQDGSLKSNYRSNVKCVPLIRNTQDPCKKDTNQKKFKADVQIDGKRDNKNKAVKSLKSNKETSLTLTLVAINMCYVVCTFPICAFEVGPHHQTTAGLGEYGESITKLLLMLAYTNNAMNFFLYCLTGSRFRAEFKAMVVGTFFCCRTSEHYI